MFFECEFPTAIAYAAQGGPSWSTVVNVGFSGYEQRNRAWALALGKWKIALYHKPQSYFQNVYDFWLAVGGRADAFRFKDHKDFQALGQPIGIADGNVKAFQLQRTYAVGSRSYVKPIRKPITSAVQKFDGTYCANTVVVYVGGSKQNSGWTVDSATGIVSCTDAPAGHLSSPSVTDQIVTADFQFHYPARFDTDECQAVVEESDVEGGKALVTWADVNLVEVRI
jgi:uncharacterized protein (TIGR02217 family)